MKDVGECCRNRAVSQSLPEREGRAAEGEQDIAEPRDTERETGTAHQ